MPTNFCLFHNPPSYPCSLRLIPAMTLVAILTMGTPVTLEIKGTVRLARGFTSNTYTVERPFSLMITIWTFISPLIPRAGPILIVWSTMAFTSS